MARTREAVLAMLTKLTNPVLKMLANYIPRRLFKHLILAALTLLMWQAGTGIARAETAVVLDFAVAPGVDPKLGREASRTLWFKLARIENLNVVSWSRTEEACSQSPFQQPYNDAAQYRLAETLNVDNAYSGRVLTVQFNGTNAQVQIEVWQLAFETGNYINGARAQETISVQAPDNDVEAVHKAVDNAIDAIMVTMKQTVLPEGIVSVVNGNTLELSIGSKQGVAPDQYYTVLREVYSRTKKVTVNAHVGELRIARVEQECSIGVLKASSAIRAGDRVRQIFNVHALEQTPRQP